MTSNLGKGLETILFRITVGYKRTSFLVKFTNLIYESNLSSGDRVNKGIPSEFLNQTLGRLILPLFPFLQSKLNFRYFHLM